MSDKNLLGAVKANVPARTVFKLTSAQVKGLLE